MRDGFIQQIAAPQTLYECPANLFVATFVGSPQMNTIDATIVDENGVIYAKIGDAMIELLRTRVATRSPCICRQGSHTRRPSREHPRRRDLHQPVSQRPRGRRCRSRRADGQRELLYLVCEGRNFTARVSSRSTAGRDKIKVAFDARRSTCSTSDNRKRR